jgi:RHS repeat-associated protein
MADDALDTSPVTEQTEYEAARDKVLGEPFSSEGQRADVEAAVGAYLRSQNVASSDTWAEPALQAFLTGELGDANAALIAEFLDNFMSKGIAQSTPESNTKTPPEIADPVNLATGQFGETVEDFVVSGAGIDFRFVRTYKSNTFYDGPLGSCWDHAYNLWLRDDGDSVTVTTGQLLPMRYYPHDDYPYYVALASDDIIVRTPDDAFEQRSPSGRVVRFEHTTGSSPAVYQVVRIADRSGNALQFDYDDLGRIEVVAVNHPERLVAFTYDAESRIATITLFPVTYATSAGPALIARTWTYTYDDFSDLVGVTGPATDEFPAGRTTRYAYSSPSSFAQRQHDLLRITDPNGTTYLENEYGSEVGTAAFGRVVRQRLGNGVFLFDYADVIADPSWTFDDANRPASCVTVIQRNGHPVRHVLNATGNILASQETILAGDEQVILWRHAYDSDGRCTGTLSPEGRLTQIYYGREDFYRRQTAPGDTSVAMWHDANLSPAEHARFANVLATVQRATILTLNGLLDDVAIYGDVFPDVLDVSPDDIIAKYTYESRFQQVAATSDPRYTSSPDPAAAESQDPTSPYSVHLTVTSFNGDAAATPAAVTYPDTTYPAPLPDGTTGITAPRQTFDAYDANGRLLQYTKPEGNVFGYEYFGASLATPTAQGFLAATIAGVGTLDLRVTREVNEAGDVVATGDPLGNTTRVALDACSLVRTLLPPMPSYEVSFSYDGNAQLVLRATAIIDPNGSTAPESPEIARFAYNEEMSVVEVAVGDGSPAPMRRSVRAYDASNHLASVVTPRGTSTCYEYDERGLVTAIRRGCCSPDAAETAYGYDLDRRAISVITPRGYVTTAKLDPFGRPSGISDAVGNLQRVDYDKASNVIVRREFAASTSGVYRLSHYTAYQYDERGRLNRERKALFTVPIRAADPWVSPDVEFDAAVQNGDVQWCDTLVYRDGNLRVFRVVDANGHARHAEYDAADRPVAMTDAAGNITSLTYDAASNVVRRDRHLVDTGGAVRAVLSSVYEFDALNRVTAVVDGAGNRLTSSFDSRGLVRSLDDALGHTREYGYNGFRDPITETRMLLPWPGPGAAVALTTTRAYDGNGNVVGLRDPSGNATAFQYDSLDRQTRVINPDGTSRSMTYDRDGNLVDQKDEEGIHVTRTYDGLGRLTALTVQPPTTGPSSGEEHAQFAYEGAGTLVSHANAILSVDRRCDSLGRCYQETLTFGGSRATLGPRTIQREFDAVGNRVGVTYPSGQTLRYEYAPDNHLVGLAMTANAAGYPGDPSAMPSRSILGKQWVGDLAVAAQLGNGVTTAISYDAAGRRIADACALPNGDDLLLLQLWDGAGNRALTIETESGVTQGWWHGYDATDRLVASLSLPHPSPVATGPLAPPTTPLPVSSFNSQQAIDAVVAAYGAHLSSQPEFTYDPAGNRSIQSTAGGTVSYATNARNEYLSAGTSSFRYDKAGRLIEDDDFTFAYNFAGQLVQAVSKHSGSVVLESLHDAIGRPVGIIEGVRTRVLVRDGRNPIETYDDGVLAALHLWESTDRLSFFAASGKDEYVIRDVLDSTRLTSDSQGALIDVFRYDAFGALLAGTPVSPILHSGKYLYDSIGWYEYEARQYLPSLGRFAQPDPTGFADGPNLYTFVGNNPLSATDPRGTGRRAAAQSTDVTGSQADEPVGAEQAAGVSIAELHDVPIGDGTNVAVGEPLMGASDAPPAPVGVSATAAPSPLGTAGSLGASGQDTSIGKASDDVGGVMREVSRLLSYALRLDKQANILPSGWQGYLATWTGFFGVARGIQELQHDQRGFVYDQGIKGTYDIIRGVLRVLEGSAKFATSEVGASMGALAEFSESDISALKASGVMAGRVGSALGQAYWSYTAIRVLEQQLTGRTYNAIAGYWNAVHPFGGTFESAFQGPYAPPRIWPDMPYYDVPKNPTFSWLDDGFR